LRERIEGQEPSALRGLIAWRLLSIEKGITQLGEALEARGDRYGTKAGHNMEAVLEPLLAIRV
jgi:hypothetical protein